MPHFGGAFLCYYIGYWMSEEQEYLDCTFTVALAYAFARKYKTSLDKAVSQCSYLVSQRAKHLRVRNLFLGISKEELPSVAFIMLSNQVVESGILND